MISAYFPVLRGVPQGSHLGSLIFNIFVNDINTVLIVDYIMVVDDLTFL